MKTKLMLIIIFIIKASILAQQVTIFENSKSSVVRYLNSSSQYDYAYNVIHNIGRDNGNNGYYSPSSSDIWRTEHSFELSAIPSNATITTAKLVFFINGYECSSCSLKVTKTTGQYSYGDQ